MPNPSFILLSHPRELDRPTNSARCLLETLGERVWQPHWHRKEPNQKLLALIKQQRVGLLYPAMENEQTTSITANECDHWLLLDGTWQEARKMYNRSPYLHALPRITFTATVPSEYRLRRNQKEAGLSTAECMIQLLNDHAESKLAGVLLNQFRMFNQHP